MSIVIKRNNGDLIWFDAVEQYGLSYKNNVTKHPIATGAYISDHTTTDNVVISINAVLSDADFNINRPQNLGKLVNYDQGPDAVDANGDYYVPIEKQYTTGGVPTPVRIEDRASKLNKILPEVIAQYTKDSIPLAIVTPQNKAKSSRAVKRELVQMRDNREEFQVLELENDFVIESYGPCVFTSLEFKEDATTGDGLYPNMTMEQVRYTDVREVAVKIKTANKGRQSGKSKTVGSQKDPANAPSSYTKESATTYQNKN